METEKTENEAFKLIWQAAKSPLRTFVESKKFKGLVMGLFVMVLTFLAGLVASHFQIEPAMIESLSAKAATTTQAILGAYLGGQSIVDAFKENAKAIKETKTV